MPKDNLFTMLTPPGQRKMTGGTPSQIKRAAEISFSNADCPFVMLAQGSGTCNTESTWSCLFHSPRYIAWRYEYCRSQGRSNMCELKIELQKRHLYKEFFAVKQAQEDCEVLFERKFVHDICSFEPR
jgi:hypothetical protein